MLYLSLYVYNIYNTSTFSNDLLQHNEKKIDYGFVFYFTQQYTRQMASSGSIPSTEEAFSTLSNWGQSKLFIDGGNSLVIPNCNQLVKNMMDRFGFNNIHLSFDRTERKLIRYRISRILRHVDSAGNNRVFQLAKDESGAKPVFKVLGYTLDTPMCIMEWLLVNGFAIGATFSITQMERMDAGFEKPRYFSTKSERNERSAADENASRKLRCDEQRRGAIARTTRMMQHMQSLSYEGQQRFKLQMESDFVKSHNEIKEHSQQKLERFLSWFNGPEFKAWVIEKTWKPVLSRNLIGAFRHHAPPASSTASISVSDMEATLCHITPHLQAAGMDIMVEIKPCQLYFYNIVTNKGLVKLHDGQFHDAKHYIAAAISNNAMMLHEETLAYPIFPQEYSDFCKEYNPLRSGSLRYQKAIHFSRISQVKITRGSTMFTITANSDSKTMSAAECEAVLQALINSEKIPVKAVEQLEQLKAAAAAVAAKREESGRQDYIRGAIKSYLTEKGISSVRVEPLSKRIIDEQITLDMLRIPSTIELLGTRGIILVGEQLKLMNC